MDIPATGTILVFKTNLANTSQIAKLSSVLDSNAAIEAWNVDLLDCDRILRVVSGGVKAQDVIGHLNKLGFSCEELE